MEGERGKGGSDVRTLTADIDSPVEVIQLLCAEGHLDPAPALHVGGATRLGDHLLAALVDISFTVCALHALSQDAIQETPAVVAPGGGKERLCLELVGLGLLWNEEVNTTTLLPRARVILMCVCVSLQLHLGGWFLGT